MLKYYILVVCLLATIVSSTVNAKTQKNDNVQLDDVLKKNYQLQNKIDEYEKLIKKMKKDSTNMARDLDDAIKTQKRAEDESMRHKQDADSLKKLNAKISQGQKDLIDAKSCEMQVIIDSLNLELADCHKRIFSLEAENEQLTQNVAQADNELTKLEAFKRDYINNLANIYNSTWATKVFSQIDGNDLDKVIADCRQYVNEDKRISVTLTNLEELKEQYDAYLIGKNCLVSEYNREKVAQIGHRIGGYINNSVAPARKQELEDLYNKLRNYKLSVSSFQLLIKIIDEAIEDYTDQRQAWPMVEAILDKDESIGRIKSINEIPWLSEQYEIYMQRLNENCTANNPVHDRILGLKIM